MTSKRRLLFIVSFIFITATISTVVYASEITINENNLNVREGPGTSYEIVGQVQKDEQYPILEIRDDWYKIQLDHQLEGWVTKEYVQGEQEQTKRVNDQQTITIQHPDTHLRNEPSSNSEIIHLASKGAQFTVTSESENWYGVEKDDVEGYLLKKLVTHPSNQAASVRNKKIVIDAGHGGRDAGAIGASGTYEKEFTLKTSTILAEELTNLGANVHLTRSNDEYISLGSRTSISNNSDTDAFISIHYNSTPELPNATGINTYYYYDHSKEFAEYIQSELIKQTEERDRGSAFGDYFVIRNNMKPGILVELGFISNKETEEKLFNNGYQKKLVSGIINGLEEFFSH